MPEEPHVEQRGRQGELAADEGVQRARAEDRGDRDLPGHAVGGGFLDGVDHADHADEGEGDADEVPGARDRVLRLGKQLDPDEDQGDHHGEVDEEDRAPPEVLEQGSAHDRADGRAGRGGGAPDADGEAALPGVGEDVADQREGGRHQGGAGHAEQGAGDDHHLGAGRVGVQDRDGAEGGGADEEQLLAAYAVTEGAHGDQESGDDEGVDVADPQQLGAGRLQVLAEGGCGEAEDRGVDRDQQHGQDEHGEREPAAAALLLHPRLTYQLFGTAHFSTLRRAPPSSSSMIMYWKSLAATRPSMTAQAQLPMRP